MCAIYPRNAISNGRVGAHVLLLFAGFAAWSESRSEWRSSFGTKSSGKFRDSNRTCA